MTGTELRGLLDRRLHAAKARGLIGGYEVGKGNGALVTMRDGTKARTRSTLQTAELLRSVGYPLAPPAADSVAAAGPAPPAVDGEPRPPLARDDEAGPAGGT